MATRGASIARRSALSGEHRNAESVVQLLLDSTFKPWAENGMSTASDAPSVRAVLMMAKSSPSMCLRAPSCSALAAEQWNSKRNDDDDCEFWRACFDLIFAEHCFFFGSVLLMNFVFRFSVLQACFVLLFVSSA